MTSQSTHNQSVPPHVVILGGGFAGLAAARVLDTPRLRVTLVDRQNHHLFQPLLYQVATAGLAAPDIAQPLRHILARQENLTTLMAGVRGIDLDAQRVQLADTNLPYDYLIVALGARTGYFGNNHWAQYAPGLKTLDEATRLRREMLLAFERAEAAPDTREHQSLLSFVVVGGGPTGVETAGALAELARQALVDDFRRIDPSLARVHLIEAGPRLLPMFSPSQSDYTRRRLEKMGVTVHLNTAVRDLGEGWVRAGERRIDSVITIWAAGVEGSPVARTLSGVSLDRAGRVQVAPDLSLPAHPNVFVAGDLAALTDARGVRVPGVAPAAAQMGRHAARQILADLAGPASRLRERRPFIYRDKGSMATIGRSAAVAQVGRLRWRGWAAWVAWLTIHLYFLVGLRNRLVIFLQWTWAYWTWQRGSRIITGLNIEEQEPAMPSVPNSPP
ncbi:NAD(P)/FAD-dependent oxidoreductase [Opitutaceae bacterium TAV4]|nr:NAD(P)/FAD-dependent oxidoreductase [Opitutaceae bacterium TAV4]RRK01964.1 NAD(P)/FAD-dependent oxidoreductase [Opitutaceae bacterium TAV3]